MSKRRGRDRAREIGPPRVCTLSRRAFWISINTDNGNIVSRNHEAVPDDSERNEITRWAIGMLTQHGFDPVIPLEVRDAIWEE